ncbi:MAG: uncharacterized membrane protein YidH (DUF202 family) [Flavobacteriaceae bacterium]|jgi:uncharacterized membrane protein YidH (DUF202 family)
MKTFLKHFTARFCYVFGFLLVPGLVFAQSGASTCDRGSGSLGTFVDYITCILSKGVVQLLIAIAVVVFIMGVIKYIMNAENPEKRTEGKNFMIYSIVAITVMVSVWGLVAILSNTVFGPNGGANSTDLKAGQLSQ